MGIKKILKNIFKLIEWIIFLALIFILFLVASPLLPTKNYISSHVVSTGSMEPEIMAGSVVFSSLEIDEINKGDIIVFPSPDNKEVSVIHRVMNIQNGEYTTKGDNNEAVDSWTVFENDIKGKVFFNIPYLGYAIEWMKTPTGFITILVVPALLLIFNMIKRIKDGIDEEVRRKTEEEILKKGIDKPPVIMVIALLAVTIFFTNPSTVYALFSSNVTITGITLAVGNITPKVVINEVMWSGTSLSLDDQWIELRNTTNEEIDIGKWKISNLRDINKPDILIPANHTIPANGFFLISSYPNQSPNTLLNVNVDMVNSSISLLFENNGNLVLRDNNGNTIDTVLGDWPAGIQNDDIYSSMQRSSDTLSWYSCTHIDCNSSLYWKLEDSVNFGTPSNNNLIDF